MPRALAFEKRIAAAVADPGVWDVKASWFAHLPPPMLELLGAEQRDEFNRYMTEGISSAQRGQLAFRMRPFGLETPYDVYHALLEWNLEGVAGEVECPILITDPEGEQFWPGDAERLYRGVGTPESDKALVRFAAEEGADSHCEPLALGLRGVGLELATMTGASFNRASLAKAAAAQSDGSGASFRGASFRDADLTDASFSGSDLSRARAAGATMVGLDLAGARVRGARLRGADMRGLLAPRATFTEIRAEGADLRGASLRGVNLRRSDLRRADLGGANLRAADLRGAKAAGVRWSGAQLCRTTMPNGRTRGRC